MLCFSAADPEGFLAQILLIMLTVLNGSYECKSQLTDRFGTLNLSVHSVVFRVALRPSQQEWLDCSLKKKTRSFSLIIFAQVSVQLKTKKTPQIIKHINSLKKKYL